MGKDKVTSNNHAKGEDIFNDVNGMIKEIITAVEKNIITVKKDPDYMQSKYDLSAFNSVNVKLNSLIESATKFDEGREDRDFRSAPSGSGDDDNAMNYSNFKREILSIVNAMFPNEIIYNEYDIKEMLRRDRERITRLRSQLGNPETILNSTYDSVAYDARLAELKKDNSKQVPKFENWEVNTKTAMQETFKNLLNALEQMYKAKTDLYNQKLKRFKTERPVASPFNNGYFPKNKDGLWKTGKK